MYHDGDPLAQTVGKYMIEIWKAAGMDMNNVQFLWASEEVRTQEVVFDSRVLHGVKGKGRLHVCRGGRGVVLRAID